MAEVHMDLGAFGIKFTLNHMIRDFNLGSDALNLSYGQSFAKFVKCLQGRNSSNWEQVLNGHIPETVSSVDSILVSQDHESAKNFTRSINLFLVCMLNKQKPQDRQWIYMAPGSDHLLHKELMTTPLGHLQ